ncbi:PQQ-dependent sugar dehydrogenase [Paenibacillus planticolens]|uniref:PQQ-dependent sugar dehydrogenase n=1 Tax=Paenibacillus planticolens TaxID=2654976 RepID=UPI0014924380|nr:PQQ-dependent sugar dehydrogenase [Paenibacillus planticolens]
MKKRSALFTKMCVIVMLFSMIIGNVFTVSGALAAGSANTDIKLQASHPNLVSIAITPKRIITAVTGTTTNQLLAQIQSADGSAQTYGVIDKNRNPKNNASALAIDDKLVVTAEDAAATAEYTLTLVAQDANTSVKLKDSHPQILDIDAVKHIVYVISGATASQLTAQIQSTDGSIQSYAVVDSAHSPKGSAALVTGDQLLVTATDGVTMASYEIDTLFSKRYESETAAFTSSISTNLSNDAAASGGTYRQFTGTPKVGDWIEFTLDVPEAGTYSVTFGYKTNNNRSISQLSVDGISLGKPIDQYDTIQAYTQVNLGSVNFQAAGSHKFKFVITGKNTASSAYATTFDFTELVKVPAGLSDRSDNTDIRLKSTNPYLTAVNNTAHTITAVSGATPADIMATLSSTDGSTQLYSVQNTGSGPKTTGMIVSGDKVVVTAENGMSAIFNITLVVPAGTDMPYNAPVMLAENMWVPWALDMDSEGTLYVTDRKGTLHFIREGQPLSAPMITFPDTFVTGESGLLGLALHPDFAANRLLYVYHTYKEAGTNKIYNRLMRLKVNAAGDKATVDKIMLDQLPGSDANGNHSGGRIKVGPDGYLYIGVGEVYNQNIAQDLNSYGGKILRMTLDGDVPADNPFPGSYVYSWGHRNPQGLAWDASGQLYGSEHGATAHDEINKIIKGANYGWPIVQGDAVTKVNGVNTIAPILHAGSDTWAPSGITFIKNGPWAGKLLVTNLRGSQLLLVTLDDNGRVTQQSYFKNTYGRIRDVFEDRKGNLYFSTSNRTGTGAKPAANDDRIFKLTPKFVVDAKLTAELKGGGSVHTGGTFDLTYGLLHVKDGILAQDITINFDPAKVQFLSAESLRTHLVIVDTKVSGGKVRILAASLGENNAVNTDGALLKLHWNALAQTASTTSQITLSNVVVAGDGTNGNGEVTPEGVGAQENIEIVYIDKAALNTLIADAQNKHNAAAEGSGIGQYPAGSKAALQTAINLAKAIADSASASQQQVDQAKADLDAAVQTFLASVITGVQGDVNGDGKVTIGDLAILARLYGRSSADPDWELNKFADLNGDNKIDIEDLAIIARKILEQQS